MTKKTFITKDSGERVEFPSGMHRDIQTNKARFDLIPLDELRRVADLYARGAEKYGSNNWQLAESHEERQRFKASAFRHFVQWMNGERDEDHMAGVVFNVFAVEWFDRKKNGTLSEPEIENLCEVEFDKKKTH